MVELSIPNHPLLRRYLLMYNIYMTKQKKKRNKKYSGMDAAPLRAKVTRSTSTNRPKLSQWFFDRKKLIRTIGMAGLVVVVLIIVISGILSLFR